ncbi:MAG: thiamine pyrophosphate-binding protein [Cyanobacteriota bacterium]
MKVSDYICSRIKELTGANTVFLLSGGGMMHLLDSVGKTDGLKYLHLHHEQSCGFAAYAYSRTVNSTGVLFVTSGPGATNAISAVASAYTDSVPMLIISGNITQTFSAHGLNLRIRGFQELNIVEVVKPITKYAKFISTPQDVKRELEKAVFLAKDGRPGPVWLDIPLDVQSADIAPDTLEGYTAFSSNAAPTIDLVQDILQRLQSAKRPLILFGNGVFTSGGKNVAKKLAQRYSVPVQTTWGAVDLIPDNYVTYFGRSNSLGPRYPNIIIQNADYILSIGARLGVQHTSHNIETFARGAFVDMIDLDPAEGKKPGLNVGRYSQVCGTKLINALLDQPPVSASQEWMDYCRMIRDKFPLAPSLEAVRDDHHVDPYYFYAELGSQLPDDAVLTPTGSGQAYIIGHQVLEIKENTRMFAAKNLAMMGSCLPSAIGAHVATGKQIICVTGDGGIQLNLQELAIIKHHNLPIKIFVFNNAGYHSMRITQEKYFDGRYVGSSESTGVHIPSFSNVANCYGLPYREARSNTQVKKLIASVLTTEGPEMIEVFLDPHKPTVPTIGSYMRADGTMSSRPLEDMVPLVDRDELRSLMYIDLVD